MKQVVVLIAQMMRKYREFLVYCLIGASGVVVDFTAFWVLQNLMGAHYQIANFLSFSLANLSNFLLNSRFNFMVDDRLLLRFGSFYGVGLFSWFLGATSLYALFERIGLNLYVAKGVSIVIVTVVQFSLNKVITFRKAHIALSPKCLHIVKIIGLVVLGLLAIGSLVQGFRNGLRFTDFHWESAALFLRGENPYRWFFEGRLYNGVFVDATQAPSTIAFILPFGLFSHWVGNMLWACANVFFVLMMSFFAYRLWFRDRALIAIVIALLFICGTPYRVCIGNGQHSMISMAFLVATLWAMERGKPWWLTGVLMSASLFKYTFAVPVAFIFLYRRQWGAMFVCAAVHIFATIALGLWTSTNPVSLVMQSMQVGAMCNTHGGSADLAGLCATLGMEDVSGVALAGYVFYGVLLIVYSFTGRKDTMLKLAAYAVIANVMFYHRVYDFVTLLFPLIYVVINWRARECLDGPIKFFVIVNVAWVFYVSRVVNAVGIYPPGVTFALEHVLLILLLYKSYCPCKTPPVVCDKSLVTSD